MKSLAILLLCLFAFGSSLPTNPKSLKGQALVDHINSLGKWTAKLNPKMSTEKMKRMLGARRGFKSKNLVRSGKSKGPNDDIPDSFDARDNWPQCLDIIGNIADQSECGSCWAVSSTSVMSDRLCIASGGQIKTFVSAADIMTCCSDCGDGCDGGWPDSVFDQWYSGGVVSGSNYTSDQGCRPYPFAPCQHHGFYYASSNYPQCPSDYYDTPKCSKKCQPAYSTKYSDDKTYGQSNVGYFEDVPSIQREILKNGPVVGVYYVYADFQLYAGGIYEQTTDDFVGGHAVRILGWGTENGTDYWRIANSWNSDWGENGTFRIIRGRSECGIEDGVVASNPDINKSAKLVVE